MNTFISQVRPLLSNPLRRTFPPPKPLNPRKLLQPKAQISTNPDDPIPSNHVKTLTNFKSDHNHIRVLEVSRRADHPFAGSRLLLLDAPGNIHSISFLLQTLTTTYFDVFATLPPLLPPGPIAILGFGAGTAARLILNFYPSAVLHGWELDPAVIATAREYFDLRELERENASNLFVHVGDAMEAEVPGGFAGVVVDLFKGGSVVPELQRREAWEKVRGRLREGGRVMVNCGGRCVEAEAAGRDGEAVMEETVRAMKGVFKEGVVVARLGRGDDSCLAMTGGMPEKEAWKKAVSVPELRTFVDLWERYDG